MLLNETPIHLYYSLTHYSLMILIFIKLKFKIQLYKK